MLFFVIVTFLTVLSVEFINSCRITNILQNLLNTYKKIFKVILSKKISEHWKELVIPTYAFKTLIEIIKISFLIFLTLAIFVLPLFFYMLLVESNYGSLLELLISKEFFITSIISCFVYIFLKRKFL